MEGGWRKDVVRAMREIVFGLEDSLVSTLGTITGIAAGTNSQYVVVLAGLVLIAVEATSMAAGSYLSTKSYEAAEHAYDRKRHHEEISPMRSAVVMGTFYFFGGFVPLLPYLLFPIRVAFLPSILCTGAALFALGWWSASFTKESRWKAGMEMLAISMAAALIGFLIGWFVRVQFGVSV